MSLGDGSGAGGEELLALRMARGLARFRHPVLLILCGNDLTAKEFADTAAKTADWRRLLADPRITRRALNEADHTFSRKAWRDEVTRWTRDWLAGLT